MDAPQAHAGASAAAVRDCVFARALLAGCAQCTLAQRGAVGEREHVACASPVARMNCATLHALLVERSTFALRLAPDGPLAHAAAMKLQCGGLAGLREALGEAGRDVHALVAAAQARHGSLVDLPWTAIVGSVAHWPVRRRGVQR